MLKCLLCEKEFKRITRTHLKTHNVTTDEYINKFPNAEIISEDLKISYGKYFRENNPMKLDKNKELFSIKLKGRVFTEETIEKMSCSAKSRTRHQHSLETKKKISQSNKLTNKIKKDAGIKRPLYAMSDAARSRASERMKGNSLGKGKNNNKGKKLNLTIEQRNNRSKKRVEYLKNNKTIKSSTSLELKFISFLESQQLEYIHQYPVHTSNGSWLFDFYIKKLDIFVELDGEFWHARPQSIRRDKIKNNIIKEMNKTLARISSDNLNFEIIFKSHNEIWDENYNLITKRSNHV